MITCGFFNSVNNDRTYNAEEMTNYFEGLVSDGVYESIGDALIVRAAGSGLDITVGTGRALVNTHWIKNSAALPLTLSAADVQYNRVDTVVIKCDATDSARAVTIEIKQGTPAATPTAAALENSETVKELALAHITVRKGATLLSQSDITDLRSSTKCGWVTGIVKQVDTSELFIQFQTAYEEMRAQMETWQAEQQATYAAWFKELTSTLSVNTELAHTQHVLTTTSLETSIIAPATSDAADVLLVFVNGVLFTENLDYTLAISEEIITQIEFTNPLKKGDTVTQIVIKSVISDKGSLAAAASYVTTTPTEQIVAGVAAYEEVTE